MQTIDIYKNGQLFVAIKPDDSSTQVKQIMGENRINIEFRDSRHINFEINDYCDVFGERYILNGVPTKTKESKYYFKYTLSMISIGSAYLSRVNYLFLGDDNTLKEPDFSLHGTARQFAQLIIDNMARLDTSFTLGDIVPSGYKTMTFKNENCYNVLGRIAEEFETEFWIEGKQIHLAKRSKQTGYSFKLGLDLGLSEITPQPVDGGGVVTRLYAYGAEKNIPSDYRNFSPRLKMTDGISFIEKNVEKYGLIEYTHLFEDIFPNRTGKVSGVNALDIFSFSDSSMDFDLNSYLIGGIAAKVTFNTGQLAGYTFDLRSYDVATKTFRFLPAKEEKSLNVPNAGMRPAIGDEYVLVDITLPQSYIDAAEKKLKDSATQLLEEISTPKIKYSLLFDQAYLKRRKLVPNIGDLIWISDEHFELNRRIRITSTSRNIVNEYDITVDVADVVTAGKIDIIINSQNTNARSIETIQKELTNNATLNGKVVGDLSVIFGTVVVEDMPTTNTYVGFSELLINDATGKIYKKV